MPLFRRLARHFKWVGGHFWALLGIFVAWLYYAGSLLSLSTNLYLADTFSIDVPRRILAAQLIRSLEFPFWTSGINCGYPLFADSQTGILYPFFWAYVVAPVPETHDYFMAGHFLLLALFTYLFLTSQGYSFAPSTIGACTFMASSFHQANHVMPSALMTATWLPLSLWLIGRGAVGHQRSFWWCALVNAIMFLAGHPHATLICFTIQVVWLIYLVGWRRYHVWCVAMLIVFFLAVALCGVQVVPLLQFLAESNRGTVDFASTLPTDALLSKRLHWQHLLQFFDPNAFGTAHDWQWSASVPARQIPWSEAQTVFQGYAAVVLLPVAILLGRPRRMVAFWSSVLAISLLLSGLLPYYELLNYVPIYNLFRWPTRYMLGASIASAVLVALGSSIVIRWLTTIISHERPLLLNASVVLLVATCIASAVFRDMSPYLTRSDFFHIHSPDIVSAAQSDQHFRLTSIRALYRYWPARDDQLRINAASLPADYCLLFNVPNAMMHDQAETVAARVMADIAQPDNHNFLKIAAITHLSWPANFNQHELVAPQEIRAPVPPDQHLEKIADLPSPFFRYLHAQPRAWMVYEAETITDPTQRLNRIRSPQFDPTKSVILDQPAPSCSQPTTAPIVQLHTTGQDSLEILVETDTPGLLVVADYNWPEFLAKIDGHALKIFQANHAFRAVHVPAGRHVVSMRLHPVSVYWGLLLSALSALTLVVGLCLARDTSGTA